jgi:hypothetical protein
MNQFEVKNGANKNDKLIIKLRDYLIGLFADSTAAV